MILNGRLTHPKGRMTTGTVAGRQRTVLSGAAPGDRAGPDRRDRRRELVGRRRHRRSKSLRCAGPDRPPTSTAALASARIPSALELDVRGTKHRTSRSALRLWPEASRRRSGTSSWNLKGGTVESIDVKVAMTGADMTKADSGGPIPAESVRDRVRGRRTERSSVAEGLPPLSRADVSGAVTGSKCGIRAPSGGVEMRTGGYLRASDGSFVLENYWQRRCDGADRLPPSGRRGRARRVAAAAARSGKSPASTSIRRR